MTTKCSLWKAACVEREEVTRRKTAAVRYVWSCSVEENSPGFRLQGFLEPLYVKIECDAQRGVNV